MKTLYLTTLLLLLISCGRDMNKTEIENILDAKETVETEANTETEAKLYPDGRCVETDLTKEYIVVIGDSIAEGHPGRHGRKHLNWDAEIDYMYISNNEEGQTSYTLECLYNMQVLNSAQGSTLTFQARVNWPRDSLGGGVENPFKHDPSLIYLHSGINDIGFNKKAEEIIDNIQFFIDEADRLGINIIIDNIGPEVSESFTEEKRAEARKVNEWLASINQENVKVIDYFGWATDFTYDFLYTKPGMFADTVHPSIEGYIDYGKFLKKSLGF